MKSYTHTEAIQRLQQQGVIKMKRIIRRVLIVAVILLLTPFDGKLLLISWVVGIALVMLFLVVILTNVYAVAKRLLSP